jgi:glucokinase
MPVLAIDLGGTKLATAVVDGTGRVLSIRSVPVDKRSFAAGLEQIAAEAHAAAEASGAAWSEISRAGLIVPGIAMSDGIAWAPNLWDGAEVPLLRELSHRLPVPVLMESDRAGYVLGEQWLGIAQGLTDVVFVAIGTGIGAGIIADGRLIRGTGGSAGAVGWMTLDGSGNWEGLCAGPAVARRAGHLSAQSVVAAARSGDEKCRHTLEETAAYIGMGVANLISIFNPQMVVLGGGLMQAEDLLLEPIRREVAKWALPRAAAQARIELSQLGDRAGLLGAARLALQS